MNDYVIAAYSIGLLLLWGYAASLWLECRVVARRRVHDRKDKGGLP
ncbi:MAG: hypothetical protein ABSC42_08265 [Tepidisphaeraceae bacterium]|jgi:hypothetical protein